ncbi:MAG: rhodanese-like domain-containing protein [Candidatus Promineifilaceae bacterium]
MKKLHYGIVFLLLALVLVACGNEAVANTADININNLADTVNVQTVSAVKESADVLVLDVREQWEYDEGHIPGVTLIPVSEVSNRLSEIPTDKEVIVTCRSGNRSSQVAEYLRQQGYDNIHNMDGGILAWEAAGLPVEK